MAHCAAGAVPDDNCACGFCMSLTRPLMLTSLSSIAHPTIIVGNASLTLNVNCCRFIGVSVGVYMQVWVNAYFHPSVAFTFTVLF